jgi:peptide/nickel transport system permease protein
LAQRRLVRHLLRSPVALVSGVVVVIYVAVALCAGLLAPHNPYDLSTLSLRDGLKPPAWMSGGDSRFLLGTDRQGRDVLSTILFGLRSSLTIGFGAVLVASVIGGVLGLLAGYYGGVLGSVVMRAADIVFSFPATLVAILLMGLLGRSGVGALIVAVACIYWVRYARTMRAKVLMEKERDYIQAARAAGCSGLRILSRHLLPNCVLPLVVLATVDIATVIMLEATLSFLGIGVPITEPSLGQMIYTGKNYLMSGKWWLIVFPGAALVLFVVTVNLLGDWIRLELSPRTHVL